MGAETNMIGYLKNAWKDRSSASSASILFFILAASPLGGLALFVAFAVFNICSGALGVGVECNLPILKSYYETIGAFGEVSCLIGGLCLVWFFASVFVWICLFVYFLRAVFLTLTP